MVNDSMKIKKLMLCFENLFCLLLIDDALFCCLLQRLLYVANRRSFVLIICFVYC